MILINYKTYKEIFGARGKQLGKIIKDVEREHDVRIVVAAPALEAVSLKEETGVEVWLQHVDEYDPGKNSGWISMDEALELGIKGSLINHSEHKLAKGTVLKILKKKPVNFEIACCVHSLGQIEDWVAKARPDWILYEPPELIGSGDKSVATEKPEAIKHATELCGDVPLLVGAGVKNKVDVEVSLKMGAKGVGLASGLILSKDPRKVLIELVDGFKT